MKFCQNGAELKEAVDDSKSADDTKHHNLFMYDKITNNLDYAQSESHLQRLLQLQLHLHIFKTICCQGHSHTEFEPRLTSPLIRTELGRYYFLVIPRGCLNCSFTCTHSQPTPIPPLSPRLVQQLRDQHLELPSPALPSTPQQMPSIISPMPHLGTSYMTAHSSGPPSPSQQRPSSSLSPAFTPSSTTHGTPVRALPSTPQQMPSGPPSPSQQRLPSILSPAFTPSSTTLNFYINLRRSTPFITSENPSESYMRYAHLDSYYHWLGDLPEPLPNSIDDSI
ncbi:hypothetical protein EDC01DRAFT_726730 [Geopyxis carbonaria]|nr:hypothetical protein EDC01DRAFT_726730 [Geopyxis carbonaria]